MALTILEALGVVVSAPAEDAGAAVVEGAVVVINPLLFLSAVLFQ